MNARQLRSVFLRTAGSAFVAAVLLLPRALQAEEVSAEERMGEWDDNGERFGGIVVRGELVASPIAPGGYTLVRTYENTSEVRERQVVEERVLLQEGQRGARTGYVAEPALVRTQVLDLAPHQKKTIGTYLPVGLAEKMVQAEKVRTAVDRRIEAGDYMSTIGIVTRQYSVDYLRPLAKGEVAARPFRGGSGMEDVPDLNIAAPRPGMPAPPPPSDEVAVAPARKGAPMVPARTMREGL